MPLVVASEQTVHVLPCDACGRHLPPTELDSPDGRFGVCAPCFEQRSQHRPGFKGFEFASLSIEPVLP